MTSHDRPPVIVVGAGLASTLTSWPGLYLAGEITEDSSINGAIRSGETAARLVAHDLRTQSSSTHLSLPSLEVVGSPELPPESRA